MQKKRNDLARHQPAARDLQPALSKTLQSSVDPSKHEAELLFAGLKLAVYSAAFQTLPTKRKKDRVNKAGVMATFFSTGKSRREMWTVVSKRIKTKACGHEVAPPHCMKWNRNFESRGPKRQPQLAGRPRNGCAQ